MKGPLAMVRKNSRLFLLVPIFALGVLSALGSGGGGGSSVKVEGCLLGIGPDCPPPKPPDTTAPATVTTSTAFEWAQIYPGTAKAIQKTLGGGYVVAGGWAGESDASVISLDARGGIRWHKVYATSNSEYANAIQQTRDDGYIVAGSVFRSAGGSDFWVLKLDGDGEIVWQKGYGNPSVCGSDHHEARSVEQTLEGGYIVTGRVESCGLASVWILKLDDTGNVLWQKSYGRGEGRNIQQTADGGYVMTGYAFGGTTGRDLWVLKLDSIGNIVWQKAYLGMYNGDANVFEEGYSIQQTADGGYVVSGYTRAFSGSSDAWLLRLDASGGVIWQKAYGDYGGGTAEETISVRQTLDGGYVVAGHGLWTGNFDFWVFKLDVSGNVLWQKAYGNSSANFATSLQLTADGGYILAGNNGDSTTIIKLPSDGSSRAALTDTDVLPQTTDALAADTSAIAIDTEAVVTDTVAEAHPG